MSCYQCGSRHYTQVTGRSYRDLEAAAASEAREYFGPGVASHPELSYLVPLVDGADPGCPACIGVYELVPEVAAS